jgi:hypothetical protein
VQLLVSFLWIEGEAERRRIVVSPGAVYIERFTARWKGKTVCGQGFETDDCGSVIPLST